MKITFQEQSKILKLISENYKCIDISNLMNLSYKLVNDFIRRRRKKKKLNNRKYYSNDYYFDNIDTEEKAYWLGFILGDGSVCDNCLKLELSNKDTNHLYKFQKSIQTNNLIKKTAKNCSVIKIHSKNIIISLKNLGVVPQKTYKSFHTPIINQELLKHLYRGILDADGWITKSKTKYKPNHTIGILSYHKDILEEMQNWISVQLGEKIGCLHKLKRCHAYQLTFCGNKNFIKLYNLLYKDINIFLDRKKELADTFYKNIISYSSNSPNKSEIGIT